MKGFSLLELVVATAFFCMVLLAGYAAVDSESFLGTFVKRQTETEKEANYRILVLRSLLQESSSGFHKDPLTAEIPNLFPDLNFGRSPRTDCFSVAIASGLPMHFFQNAQGKYVAAAQDPLLKAGETIAAGGNCADLFCWTYARIRSTTVSQGFQELDLDFFLPQPPASGSLVRMALHGFQFKKNTLYWISPGGSSEPFWGPLDQFEYKLAGQQLTLLWKAGLTTGRSVIDL